MLKWILLGGVSHSLHWIPDNPRSYVRTSDGCAWNGADRVVQLRSYLDGGGEEMKRLIEWLDNWALEHEGTMLLLNILFISIAVVCTALNVRGLLR